MRFPAAAAAAVETVGKAGAPKSVAVVGTLFECDQMPPPFTPMYRPVQVMTGGGMYAGGGALRDGRSAASAEPAIVAVATEAIRILRNIVVPPHLKTRALLLSLLARGQRSQRQ